MTDQKDDGIVDRSRTIADRVEAKRIPGEEKAYTDSLLQAMRNDGLLSVVVPPAFGGPGLDVGDAARVVFNIARVSGSAGLIYAMHLSQALTVVRHGGDSPFFNDFRRSMVKDQILIASGTSEKGVGGDIFGSVCSIEEGANGHLSLEKESPNISYIDHAGAILVTAMREKKNGKKTQVLVLAEADNTEFAPGRDPQLMGMRGILNRPWKFKTTFSEEAIFPQPYPAIARETMIPSIHIFWAALWSGIAWSTLDKAKTYVAKELASDGEVDHVIRHELTRIVNRHHMMNAVIRDAISAYENRSGGTLSFDLSAQINRVKVVCSELLIEICTGALGLIGIRGYSDGGPYSLSENLRDALSGPLMVSNYRLSLNNAKIESYVDETV